MMMTKRLKPTVNPAYAYAIRTKQYTLAQAEAEEQAEHGKLSPYDLGEFRKVFQKARCDEYIQALRNALRYMRTDDAVWLQGEVIALYKRTLGRMYGDGGANEFLSKVYPELMETTND